MSFCSFPFVIFLVIIIALFAIIPAKSRWFVLLIGSYFFYACLNAWYLLLVLAAVTAINFGCSIFIHRSSCPKTKLTIMWMGIAANIGILVAMKYLPFLVDNLNKVLGLFPGKLAVPVPQLLASIGVSFFVFQGISYLVDIYLEVLEPERHPGYFALSLCFFPKLLQGPIERSGKLLPQIHALRIPSLDTVRAGMSLVIWGMFKKVVIADRIAAYVDPVYSNVHAWSGLALVSATYLFAIQIYFDFSGYTDMALGIARLFNIRLTQNFNSPYLATSTADFWRRWHITFSSWILDYIFKPIQLSLRNWTPWGIPTALMITFLISGLWHGASWCYVFWGGLHGVYLSVGTLSKKLRSKMIDAVGLGKTKILIFCQMVVTFHLVCFAWIFFRAENITDAFYVVRHTLLGCSQVLTTIKDHNVAFVRQLLMGRPGYDICLIFVLVSFVAVVGFWERKKKEPSGELRFLNGMPDSINGVFWGVIVYMIVFWGASSPGFIYQQF